VIAPTTSAKSSAEMEASGLDIVKDPFVTAWLQAVTALR